MRFELGGTISSSGPPGPGNPSNPPELFLTYNADDTLDVKSYADQGYTAYEVLCVGAAGGNGGGYYMPPAEDTTRAPGDFWVWGLRFFGGGAGGGGIHKIAGDLLALPDSVVIKVGAGGAAGAWQTDPDGVAVPTSTGVLVVTASVDGDDGGYSSFNDPVCRASGGKGGKRVQAVWLQGSSGTQFPHYSFISNPLHDGGDGGLGDSTVAGGGGVGAKQKIYDGSGTLITDVVAAGSGGWDGTIGGGGGGGYGGGDHVATDYTGSPPATEDGQAIIAAGDGSVGAYSFTDTSFTSYSAPYAATRDPLMFLTVVLNDVAGSGGGAQTSPFTGFAADYGDGVQLPLNAPGGDGVVIVRLYAK